MFLVIFEYVKLCIFCVDILNGYVEVTKIKLF